MVFWPRADWLRSWIKASHCSGWLSTVGRRWINWSEAGVKIIHGLGAFETASIPSSPFHPRTF